MLLRLVDNARAPQHRLYPQHQLRNGEGLGHIIVGTERKPLNDLLVTGSGSQHDDRLFRIGGTQPVADFEPIHSRQHDVQKYQIKATAQCFLNSGVAVRSGFHRITVVQKHIHQSIADRLFIFNDQYVFVLFHRVGGISSFLLFQSG